MSPRPLIVAVACLSLTPYQTGQARPPAGGPTPEADWFRSLKQPGTDASCCDLSDCHRVRDQDVRTTGGHWEFKLTKESFRDTITDNQWHKVPEDKWLRNKDNPTGHLVICGNNWGAVGGGAFNVWCAIKPFMT